MLATIQEKHDLIYLLKGFKLLPKRLKTMVASDPWREILIIGEKPWFADYRWEVDPIQHGFLQTPEIALWWAKDMMEGGKR